MSHGHVPLYISTDNGPTCEWRAVNPVKVADTGGANIDPETEVGDQLPRIGSKHS